MKMLLMLSMILTVSSCTDGKMAKVLSYGSSRTITCWSGGVKIYEGRSTGKISSEQNSDGYYFTEEGSNKLMEVSGNCVLGK